MIEVSSFLSGKNLCNILANSIVKKINELSPDAITQIKVINVRSFFIVKGTTSSSNLVNVSEILSDIYKKYDEKLVKTVRVIDTILYNVLHDGKLNIELEQVLTNDGIEKNLKVVCDKLQSEGLYINLKIHDNNLYYDFEHKVDYNSEKISSLFPQYTCIKDDFSNEIYTSDKIYGLSNTNEKYYHLILKKISFNLLSRSFSKKVKLQISSNEDYSKINSENIKISLDSKTILHKEKLLSMLLDVFNFELGSLKKEFDLSSYEMDLITIDNNHTPIWENYNGTKDLMFL